MKIFLDSAKLNEIKQAFAWGVIDGITTNPSLMKKAINNLNLAGSETDMHKYIEDILKVAGKNAPVSLEVISLTEEKMYSEAKTLYNKFSKIADNVVIKIPICTAKDINTLNFDALKVIKKLSDENIPVNATLIFTPEQALLAAKAGAKFVSPFLGRIDYLLRSENLVQIKVSKSASDKEFAGQDYYPSEGVFIEKGIAEDNGVISGVDLLSQIIAIFDNYEFDCQIIAASIRNSRQARESALEGADIATLPFSVIKEMLWHKKSAEGIIAFENDVVDEYKDLFD